MSDNTNLIKQIEMVDWEFKDQDTQYLSHNIHRYSGKFIPQIARSVMDIISEKNDTILDPYVGSGTTALEAMISGRKCIGIDINPLAILISEVKTNVIPVEELEQFRIDLKSSLEISINMQSVLFDAPYSVSINDIHREEKTSNEWNQKWYQPEVLEQLVQIYAVIENISDESLQKIAKVAFSSILRKSSNASSRYPNVMYDKNHKKKSLPLKSFIDSFDDLINKLQELSRYMMEKPGEVTYILGNNTRMHLEDSSVDAIITHPPYIAAVPYAEYNCLSLEWFGYSSKELDSEITGGKRHRKDVVERFRDDYEKMIAESYRVLKPQKYAFFMVGNPTAGGKKVNLHDMTVEIAKKIGFEYIYTAVRKGMNRRGNNMGEEYLEFFRKR